MISKERTTSLAQPAVLKHGCARVYKERAGNVYAPKAKRKRLADGLVISSMTSKEK
jgi:hypothetical protein